MKWQLTGLSKTFLGCLMGLGFCLPALAAPFWQTVSAGYRLEWTDTELRYLPVAGGQPVSLFAPFETDPEMKCTQEHQLRPLSLVGPYLSLRGDEYWNCERTAHPGAVGYYHTLDLRHPQQKLVLTDLFPAVDVFQALLHEPLIAATLKRQLHDHAKPPATLKALIDWLEASNDKCEYAFEQEMLAHFAFHHLKGDQVVIRIGLSHGCEVARGRLTELNISLKLPPALKPALLQAARGQGFLMEQSPKRPSATRSMTDPGYHEPS